MRAHSLRSEAAVAIYIAGVSPLKIIFIGRWQIESFLLYIRKQVAQFSTKVSDKMQQQISLLSRTLTEQSKNQKLSFTGFTKQYGII